MVAVEFMMRHRNARSNVPVVALLFVLLLACTSWVVEAGIVEGDIAWYNPSSSWNISGSAATGDNQYGDELGFKVVVVDSGATANGKKDICALNRFKGTIDCYYYTGSGLPSVPDFTFDKMASGCVGLSSSTFMYSDLIAADFGDGCDSLVFLYDNLDTIPSSSTGNQEFYVGKLQCTPGSGYSLTASPNEGCPNSYRRLLVGTNTMDDRRAGSYSLAAGDVLGDSDPDVVVGIVTNRDNVDSGGTCCFDGGDLGGGTPPYVIYPWPGTNTGKTGVANMEFGATVKTGTFSQISSKEDVFITAQRGTVITSDRLYFQGTVLAYSGFTSDEDDYYMILRGPHTGCLFGFSIAFPGDVNGDGYDDVLIGVPFYSQSIPGKGSSLYGDSGQVVVLFGKESYSSLAANASLYVNHSLSENGMTLYNPLPQSNSRFGWSMIGIGDVNGDGLADIAVGAPGMDGYRGKVMVFRGSSSGVDPSPFWVATGPKGSTEMFGFSMYASDFDDDTIMDLVISGYGEWGTEGAVYLYYPVPNTNFVMNMTSPDDGSTLLVGDPTHVNITISNNGPRDVDELRIVLMYDSDIFFDSIHSFLDPFSCVEATESAGEYHVLTCNSSSTIVVAEDVVAVNVGISFSTADSIVTKDRKINSTLEFEFYDLSEEKKEVLIRWESRAALRLDHSNQTYSSLYAGQENKYSYFFINDGPSPAQTLKFSFPFILSDYGLKKVGYAYGIGSCIFGSNTLTCLTTQQLKVSETVEVSVLTAVDPSFTKGTAISICNGTTSSIDSDASNNNGVQFTSVSRLCDFKVVDLKFTPTTGQKAGNPIRLLTQLSQAGPSSCANVDLFYDMPLGSVFQDVSSGVLNLENNTCTSEDFVSDNVTRIHCIILDHLPNVDQLFSVKIKLPESFYADQADVFVNATTETPEVSTTNQQKNVTLPISQASDVSVVISKLACDYEECFPGNYANYTLTVYNSGPSAIRNLWVNFTYPAESTLVAWYQGSADYVCTHSSSDQTVSCMYLDYLNKGVPIPVPWVTYRVLYDIDITTNETHKYAVTAEAAIGSEFLIDSRPSDNTDDYTKLLGPRQANLGIASTSKTKYVILRASEYTNKEYPEQEVDGVVYRGGVMPETWDIDTDDTTKSTKTFERGRPSHFSVYVRNEGKADASNVTMIVGIMKEFQLREPDSSCKVLKYPDGVKPIYPYPATDVLFTVPDEINTLGLFYNNATDYTFLRCALGDFPYSTAAVASRANIGVFYASLNDSVEDWEAPESFLVGIYAESPDDPQTNNNYLSTSLLYSFVPQQIFSSSEPQNPNTTPAVVASTFAVVFVAIGAAFLLFMLLICLLCCFLGFLATVSLMQRERRKRRQRKRRKADMIRSIKDANIDENSDDSDNGVSDDDEEEDDDDDDDEDASSSGPESDDDDLFDDDDDDDE